MIEKVTSKDDPVAERTIQDIQGEWSCHYQIVAQCGLPVVEISSKEKEYNEKYFKMTYMEYSMTNAMLDDIANPNHLPNYHTPNDLFPNPKHQWTFVSNLGGDGKSLPEGTMGKFRGKSVEDAKKPLEDWRVKYDKWKKEVDLYFKKVEDYHASYTYMLNEL